MARYTPAKISTQELATLAFAAYRYNNGNVHKDTSFFDRAKDTLVAVTPNKNLIREGNLQVTEQDRIDSQTAIDLLSQDRMMRILKGLKVADFQNTLTNLTMQAECTISDAGLMAFLPSMAEQISKRQAREQEVSELAYTSEFLGKVGDKIVVELTVMNSRYVQQYGCWSVNAKDEKGNLISYLTAKEECTKNGRYTAKIKRTENSAYHNNARVTTLNFVKFA
jgi:hypothetical protein